MLVDRRDPHSPVVVGLVVSEGVGRWSGVLGVSGGGSVLEASGVALGRLEGSDVGGGFSSRVFPEDVSRDRPDPLVGVS